VLNRFAVAMTVCTTESQVLSFSGTIRAGQAARPQVIKKAHRSGLFYLGQRVQ